MLLIAAPHAHGFGGCLMPCMSRAGIASVMVEWLEARGSKNSIMACRRDAPPGFRAAPRAANGVMSIRLQSLTPSHLQRCALRLLPREQLGYGAALLIVDSMYGLRFCINRRIHSSFNSGGTSSADGAKPSAFNAPSLAFDIASVLTRSSLRS